MEGTGKNEIGQKPLLVKGISVFGIGHILAIFHWLGKMESSMELLMTSVKDDAISSAIIFVKFMVVLPAPVEHSLRVDFISWSLVV